MKCIRQPSRKNLVEYRNAFACLTFVVVQMGQKEIMKS